MHRHKIIHNDVKPSNLIFDSLGYIKLTDFGLATVNRLFNVGSGQNISNWTAPEVLSCQRSYSYEADYWSVGVIAYQLMMGGELPYKGSDPNQIKKALQSTNINLRTKDIPHGWSWQAADFINKCLQKSPEKRIGIHRGSLELK